MIFTGPSEDLIRHWRIWQQRWAEADSLNKVYELELKEFVPKCPEIPMVKDYRVISDMNFWDRFPKNHCCPAEPGINAKALKGLIDTFGVTQPDEAERVLEWTRRGALVGCNGQYRAASSAKNANNSYQNGPQVTDAIGSWIKKGYVYGPVEEEEVPANAKINSILTRTKPNGAVRVILNLSAPEGCSVNDGIDIDNFPAFMSSTGAWLKVLNECGRDCWIMKIDFADAYKQITVVEADTELQWFEWGGKYFKELCLVFGCSSSAGIFDCTAKLILDLVCRKANFPRGKICQHLDDICAAAEKREDLMRFDANFAQIAEILGVKLASREDKDKSFEPSKCGVVLGVEYDTESWTWKLPADKKAKMCMALKAAAASERISAKDAMSLVGKVIHIKPLLPSAKFNVNHIMALGAEANRADSDRCMLTVSEELREQLRFWIVLMECCSQGVGIPSPVQNQAAWALNGYTDAAGGSTDKIGQGTGGVLGQLWYYIPWSKKVCAGGWRVDGIKVGRKLSALELVGPLVLLVVARRQVRGNHVNFWVDNAGSVAIWNKGYSSGCRLSSTLVVAISAVAAALGCFLQIRKITRCSDTGSLVADALSKAEFQLARGYAASAGTDLDMAPATIPRALLSWIDKPVPDDQLAHRILKELAKEEEILGYSVK